MKKILVIFVILVTLISVVSCNQEVPKKQLCNYSVEFLIDGVDATDELSYLLDGVKLQGYEGTVVDISEYVLWDIPEGIVLNLEQCVLEGELKADNSLKLSVFYTLDRSKIDYTFGSNSKHVKYYSTALGSAKFDGVIADDTASNGYALSSTREKGTEGGLAIDIGQKNVADYERILLRVRVTGSQQYKVVVNNSADLFELEKGSYRVYDLKPFLEENGIAEISSLAFLANDEYSGSVLVDSILFVNDDTVRNYDDSYCVRRDDSSYYLSDFNNQGIMSLVETIGIGSTGQSVTELCDISHDFAPNDKVHYNVINRGIKLQVSSTSSFKYNLPMNFDLSSAKEIVIRFTSDEWHGGAFKSFFHFTNGEEVNNIIKYCKIYYRNGQSASGEYSTTDLDTLYGQGYRRCTLVLDVESFINDTGMTEIDGIIFGFTRTTSYMTHFLDEIYFTVDGSEKEIPNTEFVTGNVDNQGYYLEDTAHGLQISGTSWTYAGHILENEISGSDIQTLTVRYKESGSEQALIKFMSGDKEIYFNLTKATAGNQGVISKIVDEYGFTLITLDFTQLPSDSWTLSERSTLNLTEIKIGTTNNLATPIFDYVAYNN